RGKNSHSQLSHPRIPETDLRLLRRRRATSPASLSRFREGHPLGGDLHPAVQLRQQSGKRSDSYSIHPPGVGILHESPAGNSGYHGGGERLGRAANLTLSQRPSVYHPTWITQHPVFPGTRSRSSRLASAGGRRQSRKFPTGCDAYFGGRRRRGLQEPP